MYCTIEQAKDSGATGTDEQVEAAIVTAGDLIDAFTGTIWETRALTIVTRVQVGGEAFLPYVVQDIDSVTPVGPGTPPALPASGYLVLSSTIKGQVDAVVLGGQGWADPLIVGAEPWNGGWGNLLAGSLATGQVACAGTYGPAVTPPQVVDATRALAAWRTQGGALVTAPTNGALEVDDEGDSMAIVIDADQVTTSVAIRTTGLPAADAILAPLVARPVLIGG